MTVTVIILSVAIFAFLIGVSAGIAIASGRGKFLQCLCQKEKNAHLMNSSEAAPRFVLVLFCFAKKQAY